MSSTRIVFESVKRCPYCWSAHDRPRARYCSELHQELDQRARARNAAGWKRALRRVRK